MGTPNSTNMSILRFSSFALLLVLLTHSAAASPLSEVVTNAVNDSPSVAADQEKIENVDARTNDKPELSDAVVPEDYLELSQMAARVGTEPQPCASCEQVPCGHCQEGCPGSECTAGYPMDKPESTSRNWCANNNAGIVPPQCRPEASTPTPTPTPTPTATDAPTQTPTDAPTQTATDAPTASTIDCSKYHTGVQMSQHVCTSCFHGSWQPLDMGGEFNQVRYGCRFGEFGELVNLSHEGSWYIWRRRRRSYVAADGSRHFT